MKVISFLNIKGGTGKTMTTINLGGELAKRGKVLLIDNDPQSSLTQILNVDNEFKMLDLYNNANFTLIIFFVVKNNTIKVLILLKSY